MTNTTKLWHHEKTTAPGKATVTVDATTRAAHQVNPRLFGKFCEHLGANIYHGMEAQILFNPTFGKWRFSAGDNHVDGGVREETERERVSQRITMYAERLGWPDAQRVIDAYFAGGAYGWFPAGDGESIADDVRLSPDVGPHGSRAQRVEILRTPGGAARGIGGWTYVPLHRTRTYHFRIVARAIEPCTLDLSLAPAETGSPATQTQVSLTTAWQTLTGTLVVPAEAPADALYQASLTSHLPAHVVIDRVLLYPDDAVDNADPDVIRLLREAHLPLLRWPGGNFVSGYHWRDGVGPIDARPTLPNPAWDGLEFNLFGTDEFVAFCRAVGCEPMICANAGNGTAQEAAAWVEYCNGAVDTPMGRLRAENGHPDPYDIRLWEIGNEIYGHWQVGWTTSGGNVDRYLRFRAAILAVDPTVHVLGCGYGNEPDSEWDHQLIDEAAETLQTITDHILTGGSVNSETDPVELYQAFMGYPSVLEQRYRDLEARMRQAGIPQPHLAITELQLFAHFQGETTPEGKLTPAMMPRPDTVAEALSLTEIVNTCIRLGDFVELITHSATVNHGGGLRKQRERVYATPVHYAHALGHALAGATPVAVRVASETFSTEHAFVHIPPMSEVPVVDAMAVVSKAGHLILTLVHRGGDCGPLDLSIDLEGFRAQGQAEVITLAGETWYDKNTLETPERVVPRHSKVSLTGESALLIILSPYSVTQITLKEAK